MKSYGICLLLASAFAIWAGPIPTIDGKLASERPSAAVLAQVAELRGIHLEAPLESVTWNKTLIAPSGDKHDYISTGPYWWPDPDSPNGLPYIRRDGVVNPESRENDFMKLNRMLSAVCWLAPCYYFEGDEEAAARAVEQLRTFFLDPETAMNPHLTYGQSIPGREDGRAIGIIDTYSMVDLIDGIAMLQEAEAMTPEDYRRLQQWFRDYMDWMRSEAMAKEFAGSLHNIAVAYRTQIAAYAVFCRDYVVAREHLEILQAMIPRFIKENGVLPYEIVRTRSWDYSIYAMDILFSAVELARKLGLDWTSAETLPGQRIRASIDNLCGYIGRESEWPHQQLNGPIDTNALGNILRKMYYFTGEEQYRNYYRQLAAPRAPLITQLFYPEP